MDAIMLTRPVRHWLFRQLCLGKQSYLKNPLWDRMFHFYNLPREEFLTHYHKRPNVETTFHMIKSKFGQRLWSKTLTAQIKEALCKILCHNLCVVIQSVHELGIDATFGTGAA
jgi:hypothetical protein